MNYLVAGGKQVDAGKTTFTLGLVEYLSSIGSPTTGYKPRAGNDYWYDYDDYRHAVENGSLYGKDARKLAEVSRSDVKPWDINPVHRLWKPSVDDEDGILGRESREFVADRVRDEYVVNANIDAEVELPADENRVREVATLEEFNEVMKELHMPVLEEFAGRVESQKTAVVESYGDIALPLDTEFDRVAVVEPERVGIYDGGRFVRACEVVGGTPREGQFETTVPRVTDEIDAETSVELRPLSRDERKPEDIAEAYDEAYRRLVGK
ncbi:MAG: ATPase [Halobacteria archaeon]|nr:ATPase [Halobacteria archaeon]